MIVLKYKGVNGVGKKLYDSLGEFMSEVGSFFYYKSESFKLNYEVLEFVINGSDVSQSGMTLRSLFKMYDRRGVSFILKGAIA